MTSYYKPTYSSFQAIDDKQENRIIEWSLKRIDESSYYKKEKVVLKEDDKWQVKIELKNPIGRIVRACTVHTLESDLLYNSVLDVITESEKLCLSDVEWKVRHQRPNSYYNYQRNWTQLANKSPPHPPSKWYKYD